MSVRSQLYRELKYLLEIKTNLKMSPVSSQKAKLVFSPDLPHRPHHHHQEEGGEPQQVHQVQEQLHLPFRRVRY